MDPYAPQGVLPSFLRWIDRPGQAVRNVLRGDPGAAGRQLLDFVGEAVDAPLPGDLIPSATRQQDYVSGSELVGGGGMLSDIGVGIATDPLSYLSFGAVPALKQAAMGGKYAMELGIPLTNLKTTLAVSDKAMDPLSALARGADTGIKAGLGKLDELRSSPTVAGQQPSLLPAYEGVKQKIRSAVGAEDLSDPVRTIVQGGAAAGSTASKLYVGQAERLMQNLDLEERILLGAASNGVDVGSLNLKQAGPAVPLTDDFIQNIDILAGKYGKDANKLKAVADDINSIGQTQYDEGVGNQFMYASPGQNQQYMQHQWLRNPESIPGAGVEATTPAAMEARTLDTAAKRAAFLNSGEVGLELDAARLLANRGQQQGRMMEQARIARELGGVGNNLDELRKSAKEAAKWMPGVTRDDLMVINRALDGMPPREGFYKFLRNIMPSAVKGAMVYGVVLPKFGSMIRNKIGMGLQAAATPGAREIAAQQLNPVQIWKDMTQSWDQAYGTSMFGKADDLTTDIAKIENAFKQAKQTSDVQRILRSQGDDVLADAVEHGVLDGFVSTEEIVSKLGSDPKWSKFWDIYHAPGRMFQGLEQRGRLLTYKELRKDPNVSAAKAADLTRDALYDYRMNSPENRALRDVVPFAQFMVKAIPQSAKWMSQKPWVAAAAAPAFYDASGEEDPVYPYMQGRSRVALGADEAGNQQYLTGFGLPMESLDVIPNLSGGFREAGRDISQGLLASTSPWLKTAAGWVSGKDPYFGTAFGSYDKIPLVGEAGAAGRAFNVVAGTGALDPFGMGILRQVGNLTDETKGLGARIADVATGAKLVSVDPDVAEQRVINDYLESRPDIQQLRTFYKQGEPDEEFSALMQSLREAKARVKEKKAAASAGL